MKDYIKNFIIEALKATLYSLIAAVTTYSVFAVGKAISNKVKSVRNEISFPIVNIKKRNIRVRKREKK